MVVSRERVRHVPYRMVSTPYEAKCASAVTTGASAFNAVAIVIRSTGSLWKGGNSVLRMRVAGSAATTFSEWCSQTACHHSAAGIGRRNLPDRVFRPISSALIAATATIGSELMRFRTSSEILGLPSASQSSAQVSSRITFRCPTRRRSVPLPGRSRS